MIIFLQNLFFLLKSFLLIRREKKYIPKITFSELFEIINKTLRIRFLLFDQSKVT